MRLLQFPAAGFIVIKWKPADDWQQGKLVPGTPPKVHPTHQEAYQEAKRLAAGGGLYYVYKCIAVVGPASAPVTVTEFP